MYLSFSYNNGRVTNYSQNPDEIGYASNKPNTINL